MEFNFKKNGNAIIIYLKGRLDVHQCVDIEQEISKLISFETISSGTFLYSNTDNALFILYLKIKDARYIEYILSSDAVGVSSFIFCADISMRIYPIELYPSFPNNLSGEL